jgi:hypothetical protein
MLDDFFDGCSEIVDKNYGGCLFFCHVFWRWGIKNGLDMSSFDIVQYDWSDKFAIANNLKWIEGQTGIPMSSNHYTWLYEGIEYDGDGISTKGSGTRAILKGLNGCVPLVDEFCVKALTLSSWNPRFDRNSAIVVIQDELGVGMNDVAK